MPNINPNINECFREELIDATKYKKGEKLSSWQCAKDKEGMFTRVKNIKSQCPDCDQWVMADWEKNVAVHRCKNSPIVCKTCDYAPCDDNDRCETQKEKEYLAAMAEQTRAWKKREWDANRPLRWGMAIMIIGSFSFIFFLNHYLVSNYDYDYRLRADIIFFAYTTVFTILLLGGTIIALSPLGTKLEKLWKRKTQWLLQKINN